MVARRPISLPLGLDGQTEMHPRFVLSRIRRASQLLGTLQEGGSEPGTRQEGGGFSCTKLPPPATARGSAPASCSLVLWEYQYQEEGLSELVLTPSLLLPSPKLLHKGISVPGALGLVPSFSLPLP